MQLIVVYGLKTSDYGWLEHFYPAQRLKEICRNRGIMLRFLFPQDLTLFLATAHLNGFPPDLTPCLIRGNCPVSTVVELEKSGYTCYNSSPALILANDKLKTRNFLIQHKFSTPQTALLNSNSKIPQEFDFPFVLKPKNGSRGTSVHLIHTKKDLDTIIDHEKPSSEWIIQSYIENFSWKRSPYILRREPSNCICCTIRPSR